MNDLCNLFEVIIFILGKLFALLLGMEDMDVRSISHICMANLQ